MRAEERDPEHLYHAKPALKPEDVFAELMEYKKNDSAYAIHPLSISGHPRRQDHPLEGQLGTLKILITAFYPMVTSSPPHCCLRRHWRRHPAHEIKQVVTVRAYSSAVGAGAFVSEIFGDEAQELVTVAATAEKYGATLAVRRI